MGGVKKYNRANRVACWALLDRFSSKTVGFAHIRVPQLELRNLTQSLGYFPI